MTLSAVSTPPVTPTMIVTFMARLVMHASSFRKQVAKHVMEDWIESCFGRDTQRACYSRMRVAFMIRDRMD